MSSTWSEWTLHCDAPGCRASLVGTGDSDRAAIAFVHYRARERGWVVATDRGVPGQDKDLCPAHRSNP